MAKKKASHDPRVLPFPGDVVAGKTTSRRVDGVMTARGAPKTREGNPDVYFTVVTTGKTSVASLKQWQKWADGATVKEYGI